MKVLERNGVRKFSPVAEKFDPNLHQAMYEVPDSDAAPGTVAQVIQAGYMLGDRVLRPAMVAVAKGAPKLFGALGQLHSAPRLSRDQISATRCRRARRGSD